MHRDRAILIGAMAVLFLLAAIYTVFGVGMNLSALEMTRMAGIRDMPGLAEPGAYQFTPLKDACLSHCRTPAEFIAKRRRPGIDGAFGMGMEHGVCCLGCCWFLMALLFVGGIMNLYWIVGLAAFVALEKLTPLGALLARLAGAGLIGWALWILSRAG